VHNAFLSLLRNEITKAICRKLPYFGIFALGLGCLINYFIGGRISGAATANAWGYLAFSMQVVFADIGPIFTTVFSAMLLSEETGTGTIRAALAAPVYRWELYLAKAVTGLLYTLVLSVAALLFSAVLAQVHYHFSDVGDSFGVVYGWEKMMQEFLLGWVLSWIPLVALAMFGLFISAIIRSPGAAVAVGISCFVIIDLTKNLVGVDAYIFTKYIGFSWTVLQQLAQGMDYQWFPEVWKMTIASGVFAIVAFVAGLMVFVKEDLNR
jgi:ABC-2 type transport system permease protein